MLAWALLIFLTVSSLANYWQGLRPMSYFVNEAKQSHTPAISLLGRISIGGKMRSTTRASHNGKVIKGLVGVPQKREGLDWAFADQGPRGQGHQGRHRGRVPREGRQPRISSGWGFRLSHALHGLTYSASLLLVLPLMLRLSGAVFSPGYGEMFVKL